MKKVIEVEYVGIEDIHELIEDVNVLIKCGHYASIQFNENCGKPYVHVYIMIGGFDEEKSYDYDYSFRFGDNLNDIKQMNECKGTINNLLTEEEV
mgnify:FL=1